MHTYMNVYFPHSETCSCSTMLTSCHNLNILCTIMLSVLFCIAYRLIAKLIHTNPTCETNWLQFYFYFNVILARTTSIYTGDCIRFKWGNQLYACKCKYRTMNLPLLIRLIFWHEHTGMQNFLVFLPKNSIPNNITFTQYIHEIIDNKRPCETQSWPVHFIYSVYFFVCDTNRRHTIVSIYNAHLAHYFFDAVYKTNVKPNEIINWSGNLLLKAFLASNHIIENKNFDWLVLPRLHICNDLFHYYAQSRYYVVDLSWMIFVFGFFFVLNLPIR